MNNHKIDQETISNSWELHKKIIENLIEVKRANKILTMLDNIGESYLLAPASGKTWQHNCFPGGYVDHVNRVVKFAVKQFTTAKELGLELNFTKEELVFSALFHKLGSIGEKGTDMYVIQEDSWRVNNLKEAYTYNPDIQFMDIPDRSLYLLNTYGIKTSKNEFLGIKLSRGLADESNKRYFISYNESDVLTTELPHILNYAQELAVLFETQSKRKK